MNERVGGAEVDADVPGEEPEERVEDARGETCMLCWLGRAAIAPARIRIDREMSERALQYTRRP
ncbi:MAG TPA: hypothetical protein VN800_02980 [Candidatus Acidoferrales bacterium]|nr:hypothetical protein [Candidatus Acidoferrales bacterium]